MTGCVLTITDKRHKVVRRRAADEKLPGGKRLLESLRAAAFLKN